MVDQANGSADFDPTGGLEWRCIGPHRGGRVVAVAGDPHNPAVFYFGACAGGVWKTTDGGAYWENVSDGFFTTAAVGAIQVSDSDPNVIYAGTGETTIRGNVSHGDGVYKTTDGGKTWTNMGLQDTRHIAKVRIHPTNPDLVYVAALGHAWGPNRDRGLYRSQDGGKTWEQILFRSERAGAIDLTMDPNNPRILYCAIWEAQRRPYSLTSGGPDSSLYKSTDGGDTWVELTNREGLPKGVKGKIGVAVSPAKPGRVWALVEAVDGALFRSDDGGETWQRLCEEGDLRRRAWYYTHIFADPQDADTVWVLNLQCWKSIDGGKTFQSMPTPHGDHHDQWIDPRNPLRMIQGNDGGACVTFNGAASWSTLYNQPTAQMYHVTTDTQFPPRVYGSQQDNSAIDLPFMSIEGVITHSEWEVPGGGESGYIAIRPDDPNIVFAGAIGSGAFNGRMTRWDRRTRQERNITVWPEDQGMGEGAETLRYRFQWTFPIVISPHDPNVLYAAGNRLFRSTDEGSSWEAITDDLTRNDPETLKPSGGPITRDNTGAEVYGTIFAFVESQHEQGTFWAGTDDGLVHVSRDSGQSWETVTPPDLPEWALISIIEVSPHDPATAYLAATRYKLDDCRPYLYKTNDYGKTWQNIGAGIPDGDFTRVIREDPECRGVLYAGTETGLYLSLDDGASWRRIRGTFPVVPVHDLTVWNGNLIVATHGRSFWVLDDLSPIHQMAEKSDTSGPRLFKPRTTTRMVVYSGWGYKPGEDVSYTNAGPIVVGFKVERRPDGTMRETYLDAGKNPPVGAVVTYSLPEKPGEDVTLTFLDSAGNELRSFSSKKQPATPDAGETEEVLASAEGMEAAPAVAPEEDEEPKVPKEAGLNRFTWNLRVEDAHKIQGDKTLEGALAGPMVPPGQYQVRLSIGDQSFTESFEVVKDPRTGSDEDLRRQYELLLQIRDKLSETHDAVNQIREIRRQVEGWERSLAGREDAAQVLEVAKRLKGELKTVEDELVQVKGDSPLMLPQKLNTRLASLLSFPEGADAPPPQQAYEVFDSLTGRVNVQLDHLKRIVQTDVAEFNRMVADAALPAINPEVKG